VNSTVGQRKLAKDGEKQVYYSIQGTASIFTWRFVRLEGWYSAVNYLALYYTAPVFSLSTTRQAVLVSLGYQFQHSYYKN
jgi:hypothetical protein